MRAHRGQNPQPASCSRGNRCLRRLSRGKKSFGSGQWWKRTRCLVWLPSTKKPNLNGLDVLDVLVMRGVFGVQGTEPHEREEKDRSPAANRAVCGRPARSSKLNTANYGNIFSFFPLFCFDEYCCGRERKTFPCLHCSLHSTGRTSRARWAVVVVEPYGFCPIPGVG